MDIKIQIVKMSEEISVIKDKIASWILPVFSAIIGFFLVQTYMTVQDISTKMNLYALDVVTIKIEQEKMKSDIIKLEAYQLSNEAWIRKWLEQNQGAVDYIKERVKKENK